MIHLQDPPLVWHLELTGEFGPESPASFPWKGWQVYTGINGSFGPEYSRMRQILTDVGGKLTVSRIPVPNHVFATVIRDTEEKHGNRSCTGTARILNRHLYRFCLLLERFTRCALFENQDVQSLYGPRPVGASAVMLNSQHCILALCLQDKCCESIRPANDSITHSSRFTQGSQEMVGQKRVSG